MQFSTPQSSEDRTASRGLHQAYTPRFEREVWNHSGTEYDLFFDKFVPEQYEQGFGWRSHLVGQSERVVPFEQQPVKVQQIIARNAEVLLQLFQQTSPSQLDLMREAGRQFLQMEQQSELVDPESLQDMCADMGRRHHESWLEEFHKAVAEGSRSDIDHPGNAPFEKLPEKEIEILQWQTYANWRILAGLSESDFDFLRTISERHQSIEVVDGQVLTQNETPLILLVEDYASFATGIAQFLKGEGYQVMWASDQYVATEILTRENVSLAIVDGELGDKDFSEHGATGRLILERIVPQAIPYIRLSGDPERIPPLLQGERAFDKAEQRILSKLVGWIGDRFPISDEIKDD